MNTFYYFLIYLKYRAVKSTCKFSRTTGFGTKISNYYYINNGVGNEANLKYGVAVYGPQVVAIQVTAAFQSYKSGILIVY